MEPYEWVTLRVVPQVARGEFINAGVVLYCPERDLLRAAIELDAERLLALDRGVDVAAVRRSLDGLAMLCDGAPASGLNGQRPVRERFRWLAAPRSTVVQPSPIHAGLSDDPIHTLEWLLETTVRPLRHPDHSPGADRG